MMKMKPSEKDFLLSQIAIVLSQLESLVSQLSSVQCQEESPAEDDVSSVYSQLSGSLSWDYSEDFPTLPVPSSFYSLLFPDSSDEEMEIPVKCQNVKKPIVKKCSFVNKVSSFISSNFPDGVYNKKFKEDLLNEAIFEDFQTMWRNVGDLFVQNQDPDESCTPPPPAAPVVRYKTIDFTQVNVRSIANIPKPTSFPVHGCALDPELYNPVRMDKHGKYDSTLPCHRNRTAFGFLYGYETDAGIVPVPDIPVHGHVWKDGKWMLHAVHPPDARSAPRPPWTRPRRPPSTRRSRWPT